MPVTDVHLEYAKRIHQWRMCRAAYEGEDAIKALGSEVLPMLSGQTAAEYEAYLKRASFYSATDRTVRGLTGVITGREPTVAVPRALEKALDSCGVECEPFKIIMKSAVEEVVLMGRVGVLVDAVTTPTSVAEAAGEAESATTPYIALYYAENICNWRTEYVDDRKVLTMVCLKETYPDYDSKDPFKVEVKEQYRVLSVGADDAGSDGAYKQEIWRKIKVQTSDGKQTEEWRIWQTVRPKRAGGLPLDYIPFTIINAKDLRTETVKSPVYDLVSVNLSHYRTSADLEHGRHFTALPTAWAAGFELPKGGMLSIGSGAAWVSSNPQAKCGFLEFTGAGLASLEKALEAKEKQMAVLGARLLEEQTRNNETEGAVRLRQRGEESALKSVIGAVAEGMTIVLANFVAWSTGVNVETVEDVSVELSTDFDFSTLDPVLFANLVGAYQSGAMSWDVFFHNCKKGELYPEGWTAEDEADAITKSPIPKPIADTQEQLDALKKQTDKAAADLAKQNEDKVKPAPEA